MRSRSRSLDFSPRSMATKWSLSSYSRTWLPPDSENKKSFSRSNETKLIQSHYRELTAFRAVTAHQDLLSSVYDREQWQAKRRYRERERKESNGERKGEGWKFFRYHHHVRFVRWTTRFREVHAPLRFYLSSWKTNFPRGCFSSHLPLCAVLLLVSPSSYVSSSSNCKNGQYVTFWLESGDKILFVEFLTHFILCSIHFS